MAEILLVEDDFDMIQILTQILKAENYAVRSVQDGEEAIEALQHFKPTLIITDLMLPKMDGWKLCQKIKENPALNRIPILVLTAKTEDIHELMSYECGADGYLSKPFKNNDFLSLVARLSQKESA